MTRAAEIAREFEIEISASQNAIARQGYRVRREWR
jgi:hypothetical protein